MKSLVTSGVNTEINKYFGLLMTVAFAYGVCDWVDVCELPIW